MKTIQKDEYIFSVDIEKTKEYYKSHSLCNCIYCRNFYAQIEGKFPKLADFLNEFGVDISRPDEIFSVEMDNYIDYISIDYTVCGNVKTMGKFEIDIQDNLFLSLVVTDGSVSPNEQIGEYFTISVMSMELPRVLDEPFPTAKGKSVYKPKNFLRKLFKKL